MSLNHDAQSLALAAVLAGMVSWAGGATPAERPVAEARQELLISEAMAQRIEERLTHLRRSSNVTPEELAALERYWQRLEQAVREHRAEVARLEASGGAHIRPNGGEQGIELNARPVFVIVPERTEADDIEALDAELSNSLSRFDEMLLKEMELLRGSAGAGSAHGGDISLSGESGTASEGTSMEGGSGEPRGKNGEMTAKRGKMGESGEERAGPVARGEQRMPREPNGDSESSIGTSGPTSNIPPDIPDGSDDDLVARQIREAAMSEPDPTLRDKLWEEYRKYKRGAS